MGKAVIEQCVLCGTSFKYGVKQYDGQYLPHYEMFLCEGCYRSNQGGIAFFFEKKFVLHLESKGISKPERNSNGIYPR